MQPETRLASHIQAGAIPPFVYTYPPRSSYRSLSPSWSAKRVWATDLEISGTYDLNLYIHIPFCKYKCGYCNLYTVIANSGDMFDAYIEAVCKQLELYQEVIQARNLRTIYIGGGTPSLLEAHHFKRLFQRITAIYPNWRSVVEEVCIEASPDSLLDANRQSALQELKECGLTRINLGVEAFGESELLEAGRGAAKEMTIRAAIDRVRSLDIMNLSTDLIMGFLTQTDASWERSVRELIALRPDTISTYFLTIRPDAWFSRTGKYSYERSPHLYERYDFARERAEEAGYVQESNVRYKLPGTGGYRQKVLQFHGVPVLGVGAGARTYTNTVDYIVGGSEAPNLQQISDFIRKINIDHNIDPTVGFKFTDEERIRKRLALDLFDLDVKELHPYGWREHKDKFLGLLGQAVSLGLLTQVGGTRFQLTRRGYKYRDILSWELFSRRVVRRDRNFYGTMRGGRPSLGGRS